MKTISSYRHPPNSAPQEPDTQPGNYYVTACNQSGENYWLMLGPFPDDHAAALAAVEDVRSFTQEHDSTGRAHFMAFGTVRMAADFTRPGNCNKHLPHLIPHLAAA